jgi:hypothetical protein
MGSIEGMTMSSKRLENLWIAIILLVISIQMRIVL